MATLKENETKPDEAFDESQPIIKKETATERLVMTCAGLVILCGVVLPTLFAIGYGVKWLTFFFFEYLPQP